jgi:hypothetical protein
MWLLHWRDSELAETFPVLLEIGNREVVNLVVLQEGVHLHSRFETKRPAKLSRGKRLGSICFECQAFQRRTRQVLGPTAERATSQRQRHYMPPFREEPVWRTADFRGTALFFC